MSSKPRFEGDSGQRWECSRDTDGSLGLRVQGSTLVWDAPGLGVGTVQHHGEKLPGIPLALLAPGTGGCQCPPDLGQGHSHAWCDSSERSPACPSQAKGFAEETQGN